MNSPTADWYTPEFFDDPYPYFDALRELEPVHWSEPLGGWVITGYDVTEKLLRSPEQFSSAGRMAALLDGLPEDERSRFQPIYDHFGVGMIRSDPPDHTRLRRLINKAFTPRVVAESHGEIELLVDQLLVAWHDREEIDLVGEFAYPLPATVICQMLGIPKEERNRVHDWTIEINSVIAGKLPLREAAERMQAALLDLQQYYRAMVADRRNKPREDLMSALVQAEDEFERLSEAELLSTAENLFSAGHETTTSLIASGVLTLLRHPDQWQLLNERRELLPLAIEEMLRFESPVQRQTRVVRQDCELAGQSMRQGQLAFVMLGAANRDPTVLDEPNRFNIQREKNPHLAFGMGIHVCVGAPLARLEAEIAFTALLDRFSKLQLVSEEVAWMETAALRCPQKLPVRPT